MATVLCVLTHMETERRISWMNTERVSEADRDGLLLFNTSFSLRVVRCTAITPSKATGRLRYSLATAVSVGRQTE